MKNPEKPVISDTTLHPPSEAGIVARLCAPAAEFYSVECVGVVDSTNTIAKRMAAEGCAAGKVIVADGQTAGRGRLGRAFHSPRGTGLYLSVVLRPQDELAKPEFITTAAAVAVCRAIESTAATRPAIKWVNDVLIGDRKVCGILTEGSASRAGGLDFAVLGIGINLVWPKGGFPADIAGTAGALFKGEVSPADLPDRVAAAVLSNFAKLYVLPSADPSEIVRLYKSYCTTPGKHITVICGSSRRPALALGLDDSLHLLVRYDDGEEEALAFGEISIRPDDKQTDTESK